MSALTQPVVLLLFLWVLSVPVRRFVVGGGASPVPSGAIVMAGGIFVIAALGRLPLPEIVGRVIVLELLIVWGYLAYSYLRSAFAGELGQTLRQPMAAFAVGTWVAGSAVLGRAFIEVLPEWRAVALSLWGTACVVWVFYLVLLPGACRAAADLSGGYVASGAVLLSVVATQSLVVSGDAVLPGGLPGWVSAALILSGCLLYAGGFILIVRRYLFRSWTLADDWDASNCILHGAVSITGLALVQSGVFPGRFALVAWVWAFAVVVVVEALELARALVRVRSYGPREGLLVYRAPQWARNFTFGMFYAFTLQLYAGSTALYWTAGAQGAILAFGQYVVLTVLLLETLLFFYKNSGETARRNVSV